MIVWSRKAMIELLGVLFTRARYIFKAEGLTALLSRGLAFFLPYLARCFFRYATYYLYEHAMKERNEADFMPKIENFTFKIVSTNQQADELAADGFDFLSHVINARRRLDKGAIAFCVFIGRELAHVGWVTMTDEAKNTIDTLPYRVDFTNKEACTGGTFTITKYRGNDLMAYGYYKRFEFLRERGIMTSRNAVNTSNIASQRVHAKFGPKIYAKARYLKILWWKFWKETPLTQAEHG